MKLIQLIAVVVVLLQMPPLARSSLLTEEDKGGNGGDILRSRIITELAPEVLMDLEGNAKTVRDHFELDMTKLRNVISVSHFVVTSDELTDNTGSVVDAVFDKERGKIILNQTAWEKLLNPISNHTKMLFLHELLRLTEFSDDGYEISSEYLKTISFPDNIFINCTDPYKNHLSNSPGEKFIFRISKSSSAVMIYTISDFAQTRLDNINFISKNRVINSPFVLTRCLTRYKRDKQTLQFVLECPDNSSIDLTLDKKADADNFSKGNLEAIVHGKDNQLVSFGATLKKCTTTISDD